MVNATCFISRYEKFYFRKTYKSEDSLGIKGIKTTREEDERVIMDLLRDGVHNADAIAWKLGGFKAGEEIDPKHIRGSYKSYDMSDYLGKVSEKEDKIKECIDNALNTLNETGSYMNMVYELTRAFELLDEVYESVLDNIKNNRSLKAIKHDIRAYADYRSKESIWMYIWNCYKEITTAQEEMYESSGDMMHDRPLNLFNEWYDTDTLSYKSESCGLFVMPETVGNYIKNEEKDDETGEGCYRMECWDDYDIHWENERYDYFYYKGEVCWFQRMIPHKADNGNTYYRPEKRRFTSGDRDLNLKTPYKPGDIVLIDCRPFGPPFWAMILEAIHQYDCCFPNILFCIPGMDHTDPASKVWRIRSLKHRLFYKEGKYGSYAPMLSPLYRIRQINEDDLTGDEPTYINTLIRCGKELNGSEEKAAYIRNTWRKRGLDDMTKDELVDLFNAMTGDE